MTCDGRRGLYWLVVQYSLIVAEVIIGMLIIKKKNSSMMNRMCTKLCDSNGKVSQEW